MPNNTRIFIKGQEKKRLFNVKHVEILFAISLDMKFPLILVLPSSQSVALCAQIDTLTIKTESSKTTTSPSGEMALVPNGN